MIGFLITIHAIISVLLITVVLMQASQGGGLSGLSGTQTTNAIFGGRSAGNALSKITTYLAAIFMGLALLISLIASPGSRSGSSVIEDAQQDGSLAPNTESLSLPTVPLQEDIDEIIFQDSFVFYDEFDSLINNQDFNKIGKYYYENERGELFKYISSDQDLILNKDTLKVVELPGRGLKFSDGSFIVTFENQSKNCFD